MVISKPTPNQSPFPYTFSDNDNRNSISLSALLSPQNKITPKPSEISPKEVSVRLCPGSNTKQRENCLSDQTPSAIASPQRIVLMLRTQPAQLDRQCLCTVSRLLLLIYIHTRPQGCPALCAKVTAFFVLVSPCLTTIPEST